jgi:hypothetical protein
MVMNRLMRKDHTLNHFKGFISISNSPELYDAYDTILNYLME